MAYNIPEILNSRKTRDAMLIGAVVLLGILSFGLGRLSTQTTQSVSGAALCHEILPFPESTMTGSVIDSGVTTLNTAGDAALNEQGTYVGSRNGSVYHFPWCSGAQRIKDENKVWFTTKEEAGRAGYRPASNCKGL